MSLFSRRFHCHRLKILVYASLVCLGVITVHPRLSAQDVGGAWASFTLTRVNLRQDASIRSPVITVLDEGTRVTVLDEIPQWVHISLDTGSEGWISSNYLVPRAVLERLPVLREALLKEKDEAAPVTEENLTDLGPEFIDEREPDVIPAPLTAEEGSLFDIFLTIILGFSLIGNIGLLYWIRTSRKEESVLAEPDKLQKEYQLLKNANQDLMNQIQYAEERYTQLERSFEKKEKDTRLKTELRQQEYTRLQDKFNKLHEDHSRCEQIILSKHNQLEKQEEENKTLLKEIESVHKLLSKSSENIQQQAVKFTLAEQTHKEEIQKKNIEIQKVNEKLSEAQSVISRLEKTIKDITAAQKQEKDSLQNTIAAMEKKLAEREKELESRIADIAKESEKLREKAVKDRVEAERATLEQAFAERVAEEIKQMQKEQEMVKKSASELEIKLRNLEKKHREEKNLRLRLEKQLAEPVETAPAYEAELESLQKEHNALLAAYEKTQQELRESTLTAESAAEHRAETVPAESAAEPALTPGPKTSAEKIPGPSTGNQYDEYVRSFFKSIRKL